ncbi:hypothetical protein GCM10023322_83990 [Rugosimonospora acidiphila]|uniref:Uncharacterized protein n=1 Tax=Rugosimonospora acidiphila TaxID=556531 RepID=A0ABP9SUC2_9ACTN
MPQLETPAGSFVSGIPDRPTWTVHHGQQFGVQIRLDPLGAFSLFGVPMLELSNRIVDLSDLLGADAERWAGRLSDVQLRLRYGRRTSMLRDRRRGTPAPAGTRYTW